tara:strand:+ start:305 stop:448 length:144 start_codon:yes stop_codon:yes gene_type:complete
VGKNLSAVVCYVCSDNLCYYGDVMCGVCKFEKEYEEYKTKTNLKEEE